ncbi:MAG: hypothetical protein QXJ06_00610 [Candidatus Aenigmatarchaeota archaeon]
MVDVKSLLGNINNQPAVNEPTQVEPTPAPTLSSITIIGFDPQEQTKIQFKYKDGYQATETIQELIGMGLEPELINKMAEVLIEIGNMVREFGVNRGNLNV